MMPGQVPPAKLNFKKFKEYTNIYLVQYSLICKVERKSLKRFTYSI